MATKSATTQRVGPWPWVALACLAAGVVPVWADAVVEPFEPWAFVAVAALAIGAVVMAIHSRGPIWAKIATTIVGAIAALIAMIFAGLRFMM